MQRRHRNIEFGIAGIGEHQVFALNAARFQRGHSRVTSHTVLEMHNGLAHVQLRQVANQRIRVNGATAVLTTARHTLAEQIAFTNQRAIIQRVNEAMLCRTDHQVAPGIGRFVEA
ncbi:hypothetical protein D3C80_963410 [compost metagenome]